MAIQEPVKREFILSTTVNQDSVAPIMEAIININKYDSEQESFQKQYTRKPISLIVNTFGGAIYDGFGLVGTIDTSVTPVHTYCYGKAMSMGFMIMASGHKRFIHPLATLMYHEASSFCWAKLTEMKEDMSESERLMQLYDDYIVNKTKIKQTKLDEVKKFKKDWYITSDEALKFGVIDEIIS